MKDKERLILSIDQGTTSSRCIAYNFSGGEKASASRPVPIYYPQDGWVEQRPDEVWRSVQESLEEVLAKIDISKVEGIAVTNQRETVTAWNPETGEILAPAIVWQCRRSMEICERWKKEGREKEIKKKTGLVVDAYFSGSKILWMLENIPGLREKEQSGEVVFGTMDSWVVYQLSGLRKKEAVVTEPSNASRTMLCELSGQSWGRDLLSLVGISESSLPRITDSDGEFPPAKISGGEVPVLAVLGDQQASLKGLSCDSAGEAKCTFGTGAFLLVNDGGTASEPGPGLLTTLAWRSSASGASFATEGSVFMAGALMQWLRDGLGLMEDTSESEELALSVPSSGGVVIVPAFTGLGAPHWDPTARGTIMGLTRDTSAAHLVRASLEAVAFQVRDLLGSFSTPIDLIRIDGGMSRNGLLCQILANLCGLKVRVSTQVEATAFGAARLAVARLGEDTSESGFSLFRGDSESLVIPDNTGDILEESLESWEKAVGRAKCWTS